MNDTIFTVNRVILLDDGLLAVASIPREYLSILEEEDTPDVHIDSTPAMVHLYIGAIHIMLPDDVLLHLSKHKTVRVYASDFDTYVMALLYSAEVSDIDLWTAKGVADYLSQQLLSVS